MSWVWLVGFDGGGYLCLFWWFWCWLIWLWWFGVGIRRKIVVLFFGASGGLLFVIVYLLRIGCAGFTYWSWLFWCFLWLDLRFEFMCYFRDLGLDLCIVFRLLGLWWLVLVDVLIGCFGCFNGLRWLELVAYLRLDVRLWMFIVELTLVWIVLYCLVFGWVLFLMVLVLYAFVSLAILCFDVKDTVIIW